MVLPEIRAFSIRGGYHSPDLRHVSCDASGRSVGALHYAAKYQILASGINKIIPALCEAFLRIKEFAYPLWGTSAKVVNGGIGSIIGRLVVLSAERIKSRAR